jgi:hypothetical protein
LRKPFENLFSKGFRRSKKTMRSIVVVFYLQDGR